MDRRAFLTASTLGLASLRFGPALKASTGPGVPAATLAKPAKSTVLFFLCGGASHIDMWDMKPEAPLEFRGEFKPIPTNVPGIQIGHARRKASANLPWQGDDHIPEGDPRAWTPIAPSAVAFGAHLLGNPEMLEQGQIGRQQRFADVREFGEVGSTHVNGSSEVSIEGRRGTGFARPLAPPH